MRRRFDRPPPGPRPSIPYPRAHLLQAALDFVRAAQKLPGVRRISLVGSLTTEKPVPKDVDLLLRIDAAMDLAPLAKIGRRLRGEANHINLSADIFLADEGGRYLGRICRYRECFARMLCEAQNCGRRQHLNDDLQVVTLAADLIAAPPIDLWPRVVSRCDVPPDTEELLVAKLEAAETRNGGAEAAEQG